MRFCKVYIFLVSSCLLIASCRHKKDLAKTKENTHTSDSSGPLETILGVSSKEVRSNKLYSFINEWYGVPYRYGGCQKTGVDCSCFTSNLYDKVYGFKIPRTAGEIYKECNKIKTDKLKQGDLVFFIINGKNISHVGVYLMQNKFAHASTSKGVIISDLNETYYKKYFYSAGRLKHSS